MPPSQRITIRIPADLLATVEAHMHPDESLSDIVRRALQAYVRQLSDRRTGSVSDTLSDMRVPEDVRMSLAQITQQLREVSDTVRRFALAPGRVPLTPGRKPQSPSRPRAIPPDAHAPPYDQTKFILGRLCPRGHEYGTTGRTLLRMPGFHCRQCENELARERRKAQRAAWHARQQGG